MNYLIYKMSELPVNLTVPRFEMKFTRRLASGHAIGARRRKRALKASSTARRIRVTHVNGRPV